MPLFKKGNTSGSPRKRKGAKKGPPASLLKSKSSKTPSRKKRRK